MTAKEKLQARIASLSEDEAERLLPLLERGGNDEAGEQIAAGYRRIPQESAEDAWALANAREAIRQERW